MATHELKLFEEMLLLALHDEKGVISASFYNYGMGGAILAELLLSGRVGVADEGRHGLIVVRDPRSTGDAILDEALEKVRGARRRAAPRAWVPRFANLPRLRDRVADSLVGRGILRRAEGRLLLVFSRTTYPTVDPATERALVERLRTAIFTDAAHVEPRTALIVAIAHATGVLPPIFGRRELKARKERITRIGKGSVVDPATRAVVEATESAVTAATVAIIAAT